MNDDLEPILEQLTLPGPAPELRTRVLAGVGRELTRRADRRWMRVSALAAAAALIVSVTLSYWADRSVAARLDRIVGPAPLQREALELANEIATITDAETGQWFYERMVSGRKPQDSYRQFVEGYQRILNVQP